MPGKQASRMSLPPPLPSKNAEVADLISLLTTYSLADVHCSTCAVDYGLAAI